MNFYLAVALLWLVVIPLVLAGCCGLYAIAAKGWHAWKVSRLWDDTAPDAWERENLAKSGAGGRPEPLLWETDGNPSPRVTVLARSSPKPFDQDVA